MTAKEKPAGGASGPKGRKFGTSTSSLLSQIARPAQALVIEHVVTADCPDGSPWPPPGAGWVLVCRTAGGRRWRRISVGTGRGA
jgi:hypothetical protein